MYTDHILLRDIAAGKKADLSKVKWPRHADGTCDYDGSAKPAVAASSGKQQKSPPAVNAVLAASDNLRLRSAGSMSGWCFGGYLE